MANQTSRLPSFGRTVERAVFAQHQARNGKGTIAFNLLETVENGLAVDSGFRPERVLKMEMSLCTAQYDKDSAVIGFWQQVLGRVRALPGAESAAVGTVVPLTDDHSRVRACAPPS